MVDNDKGWNLVQRRRKSTRYKPDVWSDERWRISSGDEITYFFTRFPENFGAKEMFRAFANYGRVVDVVIPAKRDKVGQRFGFARFIGVNDPRLFGTKLDNIIIGATKLNVNAPRFARTSGCDLEFNRQRNQAAAETTIKKGRGGQRFAWKEKEKEIKTGVQKKSYAEVVREQSEKKAVDDESVMGGDANLRDGEKKKTQAVVNNPKWKKKKKRRGGKPRKEEFKGLLCYEVEEEEIEKFQRKYIGYVKQAGTTYSVQEWFSRQGVFSVKATPLGANSVLLEDIEEGTLDAMMTDALDWLLERFEDVKPWQPFVVDNERLVWVRCHGIPPHAWGEGICKLMANTMGNYVDIDEDTRKKRTLDVARFLIRTRGLDVINTTMHVTINGSVFPIRVMEEWCGPLRLVSTTKGADGAKDDTVESEESEYSESEFEMDPPLFSPEKMTEPASPVEEEGETDAFNIDGGNGCNDELGGGENCQEIVAYETGVNDKLQVTRQANDEVGQQMIVAVNVATVTSGGCRGIQGVEEAMLNLSNTQVGLGESLSVGLDVGPAGVMPSAMISSLGSIERTLVKKKEKGKRR